MVPDAVNVIGRLGENEHQRMLIDISEYVAMYPDADFVLLNQTPRADAAYPVAEVTFDGEYLYWTVTDSDLTVEGTGVCEFIMRHGSEIGKSVYFTTRVLPALDGSAVVPSPWESWQEMFYDVRDETYAARDVALDAADRAEYSAIKAGYVDVEIVNGELIYKRTDGVNIDFVLLDGDLVMMFV